MKQETMRSMLGMSKGKRSTEATPKPKAKIMEPTAEQRARGRFVQEDVVDKGAGGRQIAIGKAYRRRPKFETIDGLGTEQLRALKHYRAVFDRSEASEMSCALNVRPRRTGGSWSPPEPAAAIVGARMQLQSIDAQIGAIVDTLRDVALQDLTFKDVAMKRWGSRDVQRIAVGKGKQKPRIYSTLEPRSGKHRQIVRDEFMAAVNRLVVAVAPYLRTG